MQANTIDFLLTCGHVTTDIGCCSKLPEEGCKRKGYPARGQTQRGKHVESTHHHTFNVYRSNWGCVRVCTMYYVPLHLENLGFLPPDASNRLTCVVSSAKYVVVHHQGATLIANLTRKPSAYQQGNHEILCSSWGLRAVRNHSPGLCKDLHRLIPIADLFLHTTPDPLSWKVRWPGNSGMPVLIYDKYLIYWC